MEQVENNFSLRCDFGIRLAAFLMDLFIISILVFAFALMGFASFFGGLAIANQYAENGFASGAFVGAGFGTMIAMMLLAYLIVLLYGLIEAFTGASPGKRILGIQIAYENGIQGNINLYFKRWALKNLGNFISLLSFYSFFKIIGGTYSFVIFIGCFLVLGEKRQALHDIWAKTAVFRKKDIVVENNSI